ncbi:MAG: hypothetical protein FPO08_18405 [Geobacter sp.]|nr:MAG: hypothetical protein FPO08_18405 [Geobacter sp.]
MRKKITVMMTVTALFWGGWACYGMPSPPDAPPPRCGAMERPDKPEGFPASIARALELSEAQKKQIGSIVDEHRELDHARMKKERELRDQLRGIEEAVPLNEAALQGAAQKLAALDVERLVSRAKTRARIEALLTPAQRTLAERLRPRKDDARPEPPCGCGSNRRGEHAPMDETERR